MKTNSCHPNIIKRIIKIPVTKRVRSVFYHVILFVAICCTIMSFIYNVPNPIQVITCNKLITDHNAITQRNISHVTWHHREEICPDCSLPDCHIACLPKTFGGNPVNRIKRKTSSNAIRSKWYKRRVGENFFRQNRKQVEVFTVKTLVFRSTATHRVSYLIAVSQEVLQSTPKIIQPSIVDSYAAKDGSLGSSITQKLGVD